MSLGISLCTRCAHYRYESGVDPDGFETGTCAAFPDGIPVEIFAGGFDHRVPFADEELVFEASPGVTDDEVERILELAAELDELDD